MTNTLLELAERCEQATGPDREIDYQIMRAMHGRNKGKMVFAFTLSSDAALALVPEINGQTAYPQLQRVGVNAWQAHLGYANKAKGSTGNARTLALALCAAALRARANKS